MKIKQIVGEATGDALGTVSTAPDASGKVKIKTPTGTEIETNKDALLPGAKPGTVQMKPDAAGDSLKPGTEVVSAEAIEDTAGEVSIDSAEGFKAQLKKEAGEAGLDPAAAAPAAAAPAAAAPAAAAPAQSATDNDGPGYSWDNAAGFKDAIKGKLGNIDPETAGMVDKLIVTEPDGTVDIDQTFYNMFETLHKVTGSVWSDLVKELIKNGKEAINTPEYAQATPQEQASFLHSIKDLEAALPGMEAEEAKAKAEWEKAKPQLQQNIKDRKLNNKIKGSPAQPAAQPAPAAPMEELNRIKELAGVKDEDIVSPRFAGVQQTQHDDGSKTTDYQQGPLQMTNKVDAQGRPITSKSSYELGVAKVDTELDHKSGIRSNAVSTPGMDPNELLPTSDIAAARGVDPKKFAAFQKQNPAAVKESPDLTAMLRIAGLR
jgi:hypothetical protein